MSIEIRPGPDGGWSWSVIDDGDFELARGWARTWARAQSEAIDARADLIAHAPSWR